MKLVSRAGAPPLSSLAAVARSLEIADRLAARASGTSSSEALPALRALLHRYGVVATVGRPGLRRVSLVGLQVCFVGFVGLV